MTAPLRSVAGDEGRLVQVLENLDATCRDLANALATLRRSEACVSTMTSTLLDAAELAAIVGADVRTVRRWVREGEVPTPFRIGGTLRWRRADVERWLETKR